MTRVPMRKHRMQRLIDHNTRSCVVRWMRTVIDNTCKPAKLRELHTKLIILMELIYARLYIEDVAVLYG